MLPNIPSVEPNGGGELIFMRAGGIIVVKGCEAMKAKIVVDPERDEEVVIYARSADGWARAVEDFVLGVDTEIVGYDGGVAERLDIGEVDCFISEAGSVYAVKHDGSRLSLKARLYEIEAMYGDALVRVSQSCLGNISRIKRFDTSFGGSMIVVFKSGYRDYVSRRQMKEVKERILGK